MVRLMNSDAMNSKNIANSVDIFSDSVAMNSIYSEWYYDE